MRLVLALVAVVSCTATDLEHRIDLLADASRYGFVGISVVDLTTGKAVYKRNEDRLLLPASTAKLFTSALALLRLGPDHRFTTKIVSDGADLVLVGGGDPSLSGRSFPYKKDAAFGPSLKPIEDLADQVVASGLTRIDGDIIGDDRLFPWAPYAPSWTADDMLRDFGAPVSALCVNDNAIALFVRPGTAAGEPGHVLLDPALEYYA